MTANQTNNSYFSRLIYLFLFACLFINFRACWLMLPCVMRAYLKSAWSRNTDVLCELSQRTISLAKDGRILQLLNGSRKLSKINYGCGIN